jgi:hypothetical protein
MANPHAEKPVVVLIDAVSVFDSVQRYGARGYEHNVWHDAPIKTPAKTGA